MPSPKRLARAHSLLAGCAVLALSACSDFDLDLRSNGADTSNAVSQATAPRPEPDARGVITYPNYQVVIAQRGDTTRDVAARIGLPADELASYNGIPTDVPLREGEILALPRAVETITADGETIEIATIAGEAIQRADQGGTAAQPSATQAGPEPIRHRVMRGETAYSIARLYNVSVTLLADWNGLGPDLELREGQYLLIPVAATGATAAETTSAPGGTSAAPPPPSASEPLPAEETTTAVAALPSPDLEKEKTTSTRLALPVEGSIIRGYTKGKNEGIDISSSAGTPVKAAEAGTVAAITRDTEQVPILVIRHDGNLLTVYANIDAITVKKGDRVKRGQTVAKVRAGEPAFLHFEVREGFESVDPMRYLQ